MKYVTTIGEPLHIYEFAARPSILRQWYADCLASAEYCERFGRLDDAQDYRRRAEQYTRLLKGE